MPDAFQTPPVRPPGLPANRQGNPKWVKGGPSPNPKGRGLEAYRVGDLAKAHTPEAIVTLAEIMNDKKRPARPASTRRRRCRTVLSAGPLSPSKRRLRRQTWGCCTSKPSGRLPESA